MFDPATCYQALQARDRRFDGLFFVGVSTTGIYCRPICPARTPAKPRCAFFKSAYEAERAGFRACFRCRPELSPGSAPSDATPSLVTRAMTHIEQGFLNEGSVDALALRLGVSDRHLRRVMEEALGVSPVELAQSLRLGLAKQLLQDTHVPLTQVALASGFQSLRRFNAAFLERFGRAPSHFREPSGRTSSKPRAGSGRALLERRERSGRVSPREPENARHTITLRLDYRPPFAWDALLDFMRHRTLPGIERVDATSYQRVVHVGDVAGVISVTRDPVLPALRVQLPVTLVQHVAHVRRRLRVLFDLDAEPETIDSTLARDKTLKPLVRRIPGLRVPGAFDAFEGSVRGILGQQVSVRAAQTLVGRVIQRFGTQVITDDPDLRAVFPNPSTLAQVPVSELATIGIPKSRAQTLASFAQAVRTGTVDLDASPVITMTQLEALPGFGPWTRNYVAMRALHWPDAFPSGDLGLKKALATTSPAEIEARAERWRPWRAYAALHLWMSLAGDPP